MAAVNVEMLLNNSTPDAVRAASLGETNPTQSVQGVNEKKCLAVLRNESAL